MPSPLLPSCTALPPEHALPVLASEMRWSIPQASIIVACTAQPAMATPSPGRRAGKTGCQQRGSKARNVQQTSVLARWLSSVRCCWRAACCRPTARICTAQENLSRVYETGTSSPHSVFESGRSAANPAAQTRSMQQQSMICMRT